MFPRATTAFAIALSLATAASAQNVISPYGKQQNKRWTDSDKCAAAAQKAFPDYTAESNAKRDAQLRSCLAGLNLPPRQSLDPPSPKP